MASTKPSATHAAFTSSIEAMLVAKGSNGVLFFSLADVYAAAIANAETTLGTMANPLDVTDAATLEGELSTDERPTAVPASGSTMPAPYAR